MTDQISTRFGFLVNEVSRLYSLQFDRLARKTLGLTQAQCRVLGVLARHGDALSQAEVAGHLGLTPMAVAKLCDRLAEGGWLERRAHEGDRRVNSLYLAPRATKALQRALQLGDELTSTALASLSEAERKQLVRLLAAARTSLLETASEDGK